MQTLSPSDLEEFFFQDDCISRMSASISKPFKTIFGKGRAEQTPVIIVIQSILFSSLNYILRSKLEKQTISKPKRTFQISKVVSQCTSATSQVTQRQSNDNVDTRQSNLTSFCQKCVYSCEASPTSYKCDRVPYNAEVVKLVRYIEVSEV